MFIARVIKGIASHFVVRMYEWVWAGTFLAMSWRSYDTLGSNPITQMAEQKLGIDDDVWPWLFGVVGLLRLIALVMNGTFKWFAPYSPLIRSATAFICGLSWIVLSSVLLTLFPTTIVAIALAGIVLCELLTCMFIATEAGEALRKGRSS